MYKTIDKFIDRLITESTPDAPIWNVENIKWKKEPRWNYIDGCMMTSLLSLYEHTQNEKYLDFVIKFVDYYVDSNGNIRGYDSSHYSTDDVSESRILFDLHKYTNNEKYLKAIHLTYEQVKNHPRTKAGNFWHKKIYPYQVWLDGIYMMQPFYARYETTFNNKANYDDIVKQIKQVREIMFDHEKGLYYHCYDETKSMFWANKETGLSKHFWLRAIGWFFAGVTDVYGYLEDDKFRKELQLIFREAVDHLLKYQDQKTKMFYQIVDLAERAPNYVETSGSLLVSYAILKGVRLSILPKKYRKVGLEIFNGVVKNKLAEIDGKLNLTGICLVAGLGPENNLRRDGTFDYYMSEPIVENDAKGVGPLIMAYTEVLRG
ncbi:MAG: glycoside hydrolase family 88/105 protein [Acholeplasmataceae bacterium]|jgi:unsaturated rhamnogalacturonyl hydrolase